MIELSVTIQRVEKVVIGQHIKHQSHRNKP